MRFEHAGLSLWFGSPHTSAPEGVVEYDKPIALTVGVGPAHPGNTVEVHYRVDGGPRQILAARPLSSGVDAIEQYFRAEFPDLRRGARVDYTAILRCGDEQVPSSAEAGDLRGTFKIAEHGERPQPARVTPTRQGSKRRVPAAARLLRRGVRRGAVRRGDLSASAARAGERTEAVARATFSIQITVAPTSVRPNVSFTVKGTTQRSGGTISAVQVQFGSAAFKLASNPQGDWSIWSINGSLTAANQTVTARAQMGVNSQTATRSILVDGTLPSLQIVTPSSGAVIQGSGPTFPVVVQGTSADSQSGVKAVAVALESGQTFPVAGLTQWSSVVHLPGAGSRTIVARASDGAGNERVRTVQVIAADVVPPTLAVTDPSPLPAKVTQPVIRVVGTAADGTGVDWVKWRLNNGDLTLADNVGGDWSVWEAVIPVPAPGRHILRFVAQDSAAAHNVTAAIEWPFEVTALSAIQGTSLSAYLHGLLEYATIRVVDESGTLVDVAALERAFLQPFRRLDEAAVADAASRRVCQVRICIEVLRRLLGGKPAEGEQRYREAAYSAVLGAIGTSYEEIRLARGADEATRAALAARLGIELTLPRPNDELDQLFLAPERLAQPQSEADLALLFGLPDTRADPLQGGAQAVIHGRQKQYLRVQWAKADFRTGAASPTRIPNLDPDLVSASDLKESGEEHPVRALWQERADWVQSALTALRAIGQKLPPLERFDQVVGSVPVLAQLDFEQLAAQHEDGTDIGEVLEARALSLAGFLRLVRVRRLAGQAAVLDTDWEDVFSILVQVRKHAERYAVWRDEEERVGLTLGPDYFRAANDDDLPPAPIVLPRWRATQQSRRRWEDTLQTRVEHDRAVRDNLIAAVAAAEREALPLLRERLIASIDVPASGIEVSDWLTTRLQLDVRFDGHQQTTRLAQAVETLQGIMFALRTDRFDRLTTVPGELPFAKWQLQSRDVFDEEWRWMGSYETWRAAILTFGYPENSLHPTLRKVEKQTPAFRRLADQLRQRVQLTPGDARLLSADYMQFGLTASVPRADSPFKLLESVIAGDPNLSVAMFAPTDRRSDPELAALAGRSAALFAKFSDPLNPPEFVAEICYFVPLLLALQLQRSGQYLAALAWYQSVYAYHLPLAERKLYHRLVREETVTDVLQPSKTWLLGDGLNPHEIVTRLAPRKNAYTRFTVMAQVRCFLEFADGEFTQATAESIPRARALYIAALDLLRDIEPAGPATGAAPRFPPNEMPASLRLHAETNLAKLRNGLNIAGLELPSTLDADVAGSSTPYRFSALLARAKELVGVAQQLESAFLIALEKRDAEQYSLLQAHQHIQLSSATLTLQKRKFAEARQSAVLAGLGRERAVIQADHFNSLLDKGLSQAEEDLLFGYAAVGLLSYGVDELFGDSVFGSITGNLASFGASLMGGSIGGSFATSQSAKFQHLQLSSSFERRKEEWTLQRDLAEQDMAIGLQQMVVAHLHTNVAKQEQAIANLQLAHARSTAEFLATKFTNFDLYDFMSGVLGGVYGYFLQQATATAALAERQLAFERQQPLPGFIQADYWQPPSRGAGGGNDPAPGVERQGITGSARLLQDIGRLDQHAFETRRRLLEVSQSFSLATLAPFELQRFRETGVLSFATPMELFDRGFPGHYLRLIKRVRVSIIALVPPVHGVRATLTASGLSRVAVARGASGDALHTVVVRRPPEQIAFTGAINATGLLELEPDRDLLLPFEGLGVDTTWELMLPPAANTLDPGTIADVLVTIDYTALDSRSYREQVIRRLDPLVRADRAFSFRGDFADAFYELHNVDADQPIVTSFRTLLRDYPASPQGLRVEHVLMYFVLRFDEAAPEEDPESRRVEVTNLLFTPERLDSEVDEVAVGGPATSTPDGIISTRRGNGHEWARMQGQLPAGRWELQLSDKMRSRLADGELEDILLVISYAGRTPPWPGQAVE